MIENPLKPKLATGDTVLGCFTRSPDPELAEYIAASDWDFVIFDGEHGTVSLEQLGNLARAVSLRGSTPIARVPCNQPSIILRAMDSGVAGVHVPWVNTAAEAEAAVRSVKYWPRGQRGLAGNRSIDWQNSPEAAAHANRESMVIIHIETEQAAQQIHDYLTIPDLDVLFLGPTDLSHSMGLPGLKNHPKVVKVLEQVAEAVVPSDIALGIYAGTPTMALEWIERGAQYIVTGMESMLGPAMTTYQEQATGSTS